MRRIALLIVVLATAVAAVAAVATASSGTGGGTYRVRAIFDDASFAVQGEQVRVAGAPVGSIAGLGVTAGKQAAVTLEIDDARFAPFHANATCAIRPQSLIGEMYVDCNPGSAAAPALNRIAHGPGKGDYYLPVARTSSPVDFDIVQDIYQEPIAQRLAIILNEFGTGLAARGSDLNAVIRRADPALGNTDQVLKILAGQNKALAKLATDSSAVLGPLAQKRNALADFIPQANTTAQASATRAADISKSIQLLPGFLRQLRPLMADLGTLADQGTPLASSLGQSAAALGREFQQLTPFASAARTSLINLGNSAQKSQASAGRDHPAGEAARPARHPGRAHRRPARQADREPQQHRRDRPADGCPVQRDERGQRLRQPRPLRPRRVARQRLHRLRDQPGARLLGEIHERHERHERRRRHHDGESGRREQRGAEDRSARHRRVNRQGNRSAAHEPPRYLIGPGG